MSTINRITKTLERLQVRDDSTLPGLTTSTTPTTTTAATATTGMPSLNLPKITATTTTHNWVTPTITPPSASENPYIWRSSLPSGTVFIVVGSIAGFFLLCFLFFLLARRISAARNTRNSISFDTNSQESFIPLPVRNYQHQRSTDKILNPFQTGTSKSDTSDSGSDEPRYPQLYDKSEYNDSVTNVSDAYLKAPEGFYSTLEAQSSTNMKRKSMFVSPTAEVMQLKNQPSMSNLSQIHPNSANNSNAGSLNAAALSTRNSRIFSNISDFNVANDSNSQFSHQPGSAPQRMNNHRREISLESGSLKSPDRQQNRGANRINRNIPSVYLDAMFEDDD